MITNGNKITMYSMMKPVGEDWNTQNSFIDIAVIGRGIPTEIHVKCFPVHLMKEYPSNRVGEIYDMFMWFASMPELSNEMFVKLGFQPVEQSS